MPGPLSGLKILDFTTLLPGPYATMMMADMGAEVLRIVSRSRPDLNAVWPPFIADTGVSANLAFLGRGKRSIHLNLKDSRALGIVEQLIQDYDIVIEQFRPGVMAGLGLDYESLRTVQPALIYCSLTGYGQNGPLAKRAGHDINYLARSGLMSYSGRKETGPVLSGMQIADVAAGSMNAVIGILAAVISRNRTGQGQHIDVAMTDGALAFNALTAAGFLVDGREPEYEGMILNGGSLYDFYETKDGRYISVGALEPKFFEAFCRAIGRADLAAGGVLPSDPATVKKEVRAIIKTRTREEWAEHFEGIDACVEPVLTLAEALNQMQIAAREMVVEVESQEGPPVRQLGNPVKFSKTPVTYGKAGMPSGVHTREALQELGYTEEEIEGFERTGLFD
jgi:alpha-methylacyl-CoA racemase